MSYCRWSSDGWKSDVYTYAHVDGSWTTHVAGRRRIGLDTLPASPYMFLGEYSSFAWAVCHQVYHKALDRLPFVEIDLPYVGETFKDASPQDCANTLRMLKGIGYYVPDGVIEELNNEEPDEQEAID